MSKKKAKDLVDNMMDENYDPFHTPEVYRNLERVFLATAVFLAGVVACVATCKPKNVVTYVDGAKPVVEAVRGK